MVTVLRIQTVWSLNLLNRGCDVCNLYTTSVECVPSIEGVWSVFLVKREFRVYREYGECGVCNS